MPFGFSNVPATFQHLMKTLHLQWCIIYLDDIIIFSKTPGEFIQILRGVFEKLEAADLKLKLSKYHFLCTQISHLGHIMSKDGSETDSKKIEAIVNWPTPKTVTDVRSLLGFTNHYRQFIHHYAHNTRPLSIIGRQTSEAPLFKAYVGHAVTTGSIHVITIGATLIDSENSLIFIQKQGLKFVFS